VVADGRDDRRGAACALSASDPYISLEQAKALHGVEMQFRHLGAAKKKAEEQERQEADRRLHAVLAAEKR
jgi:hypothetical protein